MKLRCPYCGAVFPPQDSCMCPSCKKAMTVPLSCRKTPREKKRRRFLGREADPQGRTSFAATLVGNPRTLIGAVAVMLIVGGLLIGKSRHSVRLTPDEIYNVTCRDLLYMGVALTNFYGDTGRYPTTEEGLDALLVNPGANGWNGPYLRAPTYNPWLDPWKRPYRYSSSNGTSVSLFTCGADGLPGTDDDRVCPQFQPKVEDRLDGALRKWKTEHPPGEQDLKGGASGE